MLHYRLCLATPAEAVAAGYDCTGDAPAAAAAAAAVAARCLNADARQPRATVRRMEWIYITVK